MSNLLLHNGYYFDSDEKTFKKFGSMVIQEGIITRITDEVLLIQDIETLNCTDMYIIPGLIDSHIHFFQSGGIYTRPDGLDLRSVKPYTDEISDIKNSLKTLLKRYVSCGITTVVDDGGPKWNKEVYEMSIKINESPDVYWAGPLISTVSREVLDIGDPPIIKAESVEHAKKLVDNCIELNPHFVKFWFIYQKEQFESDSVIIKAGIEQAKSKNIKVMVHATELETARRAVHYGADILVHSVFDQDVDSDFIDLLFENDVFYIPTLMVRKGYRDVYRTIHHLTKFEEMWGDPHVIASFRDMMIISDEKVPESHRSLRSKWRATPPELNTYSYPNLRRIFKRGVKIVTGTDAGNIGTLHGPSLLTEMKMMQEAGLSIPDILIATTKNAAQMVGNDSLGEIAVNKKANLVIIQENILENLDFYENINFIIKNGRKYVPDELIKPTKKEDIVQEQLDAYNNKDTERFLKVYHPRVKIFDLATGEITLDGINAMRKRYQLLFDSSPNLFATVTNRMSLGNTVIDYEYVTGFRGNNAVKAIAIFEVLNQQITKVWFAR
jgi:imidazolonepropionase-like amidohydrolase